MHIYCSDCEISKITLNFTNYNNYKNIVCEENILFVKTKYGYKLNFDKNTFITFIAPRKILNIYSSNNKSIYIKYNMCLYQLNLRTTSFLFEIKSNNETVKIMCKNHEYDYEYEPLSIDKNDIIVI
jgi:hypothetical protein